MAKPLMMLAVSGSPYSRKNPPTPSSPRLATVRPMTAPPLKATERAWLSLPRRAASAVRTLALVAACMPMNPASMERNAPHRKATPVSQRTPQTSRPNTTAMKTRRMEYSRRRNTMAPSWIASEISRMRSVPTGARATIR